MLSLAHALRNIMRILGPWDGGPQPWIQRVLEGRQCFVTEFSGVGTACQAHIIIETYFRECNVYFRTIRQRLAAPIHRVLKGQPAFSSWGFQGGRALVGSVYC